MNKKTIKTVSVLLAGICLSFGLASCKKSNGESQGSNGTGDFKNYDISDIVNNKCATEMSVNDGYVSLKIEKSSVSAGESFVLKTKFSEDYVFSSYSYYLVDWGDGTRSYYGPCQQNNGAEPYIEHFHKYFKVGRYAVYVAIVTMDTGKLSGWSAPVIVNVTGTDCVKSDMIKTLKPISSQPAGANYVAEKAFDNAANTVFKTAPTDDIYSEDYVGMLFDGYYSLKEFDVQIPQDTEFPSNIAVEITVDGGKSWLNMPKYYYVEENNLGVFNPTMNFPSPDGATLIFDMSGTVCNGVRFVSKQYKINSSLSFTVGEMRAYGDKKFMVETSVGGSFDAAIQNLWLTYGNAESEPLVNSSKLGENTHPGSFRVGFRMIGSTEWDEYSDFKFTWNVYDENQRLYLYSCLLERPYGDDGWSAADKYRNDYVTAAGDKIKGWSTADREGYIFATNDSPKHLGIQRHYVYNSVFINCIADYIKQGNYVDASGNPTDLDYVLNYKNGRGQTVMERLEKAMTYMLKVLQGESGMLIITDPENDGTETGNSSNLFDAYKCFGYKSSYENIYFYRALGSMSDIYAMMGDSEKQVYFAELQKKAKEQFNRTFWDDTAGRYISSVNVRGERLDFGHTFVNQFAVYYGLSDEKQTKSIQEWLDGSRIVENDTSQGDDIYGYWGLGARTNTCNMDKYREDYPNGPWYVWDHGGALDPTKEGAYGGNITNGGFSMFFWYFDLVGRIRSGQSDYAFEKYSYLMEEFNKDRYKRSKHFHLIFDGIYGPDTGLLSLVVKDGFMGLKVENEKIIIEPNLPSKMTWAKINGYAYGGAEYTIEVNTDCKKASIENIGNVRKITVPATGRTVFDGNGFAE